MSQPNFIDSKYRPQSLVIYCPECLKPVSVEEWRDFGMHLMCTEYFREGNSQYGNCQENELNLQLKL